MANPDSQLVVVGIGASAGGIEALKEFFNVMPANSDLAFAVIQHLDPNRPSYMADILGKCTRMRVIQAEDAMPIEPNCVYTIPPDKFLFIKEDRLHLTEAIKRDGVRMPIDFFFRSLAENRADKAIAVLLSGGGSDGTLGIREIHGVGGIVIVQDPNTAQFDSLLQSALATGMVDSTLPVRQMPAALLQYHRHTNGEAAKAIRPEAAAEDISVILDILSSQANHGFQNYRKTTLWRRISRRMGLNQITNLADYARLLRQNQQEAARLANDMLIAVTSFFRDPDAFEELRAKVIIPLVEQRTVQIPLRVWTVGCATGEEAYSIAILIREEMLRMKKNFPVQIFASDVAADGLKYARESVYPESIAADVSEERLKRFFVKRDSSYQVVKEIRDLVTFAPHNVLMDPPFLRIDLVSCRNLLIYIESETQRRIHGLFAFALKPGGYLFLGKSESVGYDEAFEPISPHFRIYRRLQTPSASQLTFPIRSGLPRGLQQKSESGHPELTLAELNQQVLLKYFDAAVVLIDERGQSEHFYGQVSKYLALPSGKPTLNIFEMIDKRHLAKLRVAVDKAYREDDTVKLDALEFSLDGDTRAVDLTVSGCVHARSGAKLVAVIFQETPGHKSDAPLLVASDASYQTDYVAQLEAENKSLKEQLQGSVESFNASYEEFTSANEELVTMNEELQSTNEELETAKEELQSVNEELVTVNNQINENMAELGHTNDDLANFLNSSQVGTIFLDTHFCIRRFTPATQRLLNLLPLDVGRPVDHISNKFIDVRLTAVAEEVLKDLTPIEREVCSSDGSWYMMRCLPYRTIDNKIDGVVLTFTDVSRLKQSEAVIEEARRFAQSIVDTVQASLIVLDTELRVISASRGYYHSFGLRPEDTEGRIFYEQGGQWNRAELPQVFDRLLTAGEELNNFEIEVELPSIGRRTMLFNARVLRQPVDRSPLILLEIEDYTERRRAAEVLAKSEEESRRKATDLEQQLIASGRLVSLGEITASMAHEFNNPLGVVIGFVEDLLSETDPSDPRYQALTIIDEETQRCKKIVEDLMQFARPGDVQRRPTYVGAIIDTTLRMMDNRCYKQKVTMARKGQPDIPPLEADPQQLEQVLINLYLNALDAMPDGGTLTVGATMQGAGAQQEIVITVADTGVGIEEQELHKIFQPFFTAKKRTGLGLGLPICQRIVKNHGGKIEVQSQPGKGTTFSVYLPVAPGAEMHASEGTDR